MSVWLLQTETGENLSWRKEMEEKLNNLHIWKINTKITFQEISCRDKVVPISLMNCKCLCSEIMSLPLETLTLRSNPADS